MKQPRKLWILLLFFNLYPNRTIEGYLQRILRANVFMWRPEMGSWTWSPKKRLGGTAKNKTKQKYTKNTKYLQKNLDFVWWDENKTQTNFLSPFFILIISLLF